MHVLWLSQGTSATLSFTVPVVITWIHLKYKLKNRSHQPGGSKQILKAPSHFLKESFKIRSHYMFENFFKKNICLNYSRFRIKYSIFTEKTSTFMDSNILSSTENILISCTVADRHVCMQPLTFPELEEPDSAAGLTLTYMYCTCVAVYIPVNSPWRFMLQK